MCSLMLALLSVILLTVSLPLVVCDCYNTDDYTNCATCYQTFANALVNTGDNKYRLSRAFFPIENAASVQVKVTYSSTSNETDPVTYFWIMGGFYVIQPLEVFLYRSLFFSPPTYRKESVTVVLPNECFNGLAESNGTVSKELQDFFEYATQRLKGYAQSQSANPAVGSSYMGVAVEGRKARINYYVGNGEVIIAVAYIMPFAVALLVFLVIFIGCCCCFPVEEAKKAIEHNHRLQANSVATVLVCRTFCFYTFALDITAWARECQTDVLPSFYMKINHFINITLATSIIYGLIGGLLLFVFLCSDQPAQTGSNNTSSDQQSKFVKEIKMFIINYQTLFLFEFVIVGSAILSFTAHFPSILMAWATDPFYASRIALFYGFTIGAYFTAFHFTYILCCDVESQPLFKVEDGKFILSSSLSKCFCKLNGTAGGVECRNKIICKLDDNKKTSYREHVLALQCLSSS